MRHSALAEEMVILVIGHRDRHSLVAEAAEARWMLSVEAGQGAMGGAAVHRRVPPFVLES